LAHDLFSEHMHSVNSCFIRLTSLPNSVHFVQHFYFYFIEV